MGPIKLLLVLLCICTANNLAEPSPEQSTSRADFEKALLKTADGIYAMLNSGETSSLAMDEVNTLLDSVTSDVLKRYGHSPPVESAVLRRVLENLTFLIADASALTNFHQEETSVKNAPIAVQNVLLNGIPKSDEVKQSQVPKMMSSQKPEAVTLINSKLASTTPAKDVPDESQPVIVLNSKYMPIIGTGSSAGQKNAPLEKKEQRGNAVSFEPKQLQSKAKIFEEGFMFPFGAFTNSTQTESPQEVEVPVMSETDALKLTPRVLFIDGNGREYQLVGAGGENDNGLPSQCILVDDKSKEVLAFQKPLSMEYLILRGGSGDLLYTSGIQLCQDSDTPMREDFYQPINLRPILPLFEERNNKINNEKLKKWDVGNRREAENDDEVAKLFKWSKNSQISAEPRKGHSESALITPRQAFRALSAERRNLRRLRRFPNRHRRFHHEEVEDNRFEGYEINEDNNKREKRSQLPDIPLQGEIFDLMPTVTFYKKSAKGQLDKTYTGESEVVSPEEMVDIDKKIDEIEINVSTTTVPTHRTREIDEEINMVQPNTPYNIEEELVLNNYTEKRRETDIENNDAMTDLDSATDEDFYEETELESPSAARAVASEHAVDKTRSISDNQHQDEDNLSPAELVKRVIDDSVLMKVRDSNSMEPVLGKAVLKTPVLYRSIEKSNNEKYENAMRNVLMNVLPEVRKLAENNLLDQNCQELDVPLHNFLMELISTEEFSLPGGIASNGQVSVSKRNANEWGQAK